MSMTPEISVVIPVYNSEKYVGECIDSVLSQTFGDFELILVDDGSSDSAGAVCDEYAKRDSRVSVYHNSNAGAAKARKFGTDRANGKYITYADCDDLITVDYLERLYSAITEYGADMATAGQMFLLPDGSTVTGKDCTADSHTSLYHGNESLVSVLYGNLCTTFCGNKLYKRELISGIEPLELRMGEDTSVTLQALAKANTVVHESKPLYLYRQHHGSTTHTTDYSVFLDYVTLSDFFMDFFGDSEKAVRDAMTVKLIENNFYVYMKLCLGQGYKKEKRRIARNIAKYRLRVIFNGRASVRTRCACAASFAGMPAVKRIRDAFDKNTDERRL